MPYHDTSMLRRCIYNSNSPPSSNVRTAKGEWVKNILPEIYKVQAAIQMSTLLMKNFLGKGRKYRKGHRMENSAMANKKKIDLPYSFSHPKKLKEGNKNKIRDSKDMKNRLLPEILFIFVVPFIIFNKDMPFKDRVFLSYHQLCIVKLFYNTTVTGKSAKPGYPLILRCLSGIYPA